VVDEERESRGCETLVRTGSKVDEGEGYWTSEFQWMRNEGEVDRPLDLKEDRLGERDLVGRWGIRY